MSTPLQHVEKHTSQPLVTVSVTGQSQSRLFYFTDRNSGLCLLVDTGTEVSVLPPTNTERKHQQDQFALQAVNDTPLKTYGTRLITLNLSLHRTFQWPFIISVVHMPIIGADFLRHFNLLVDVCHKRLVDAITQLQVQSISSKYAPMNLVWQLIKMKNEVETVLTRISFYYSAYHT